MITSGECSGRCECWYAHYLRHWSSRVIEVIVRIWPRERHVLSLRCRLTYSTHVSGFSTIHAVSARRNSAMLNWWDFCFSLIEKYKRWKIQLLYLWDVLINCEYFLVPISDLPSLCFRQTMFSHCIFCNRYKCLQVFLVAFIKMNIRVKLSKRVCEESR